MKMTIAQTGGDKCEEIGEKNGDRMITKRFPRTGVQKDSHEVIFS